MRSGSATTRPCWSTTHSEREPRSVVELSRRSRPQTPDHARFRQAQPAEWHGFDKLNQPRGWSVEVHLTRARRTNEAESGRPWPGGSGVGAIVGPPGNSRTTARVPTICGMGGTGAPPLRGSGLSLGEGVERVSTSSTSRRFDKLNQPAVRQAQPAGGSTGSGFDRLNQPTTPPVAGPPRRAAGRWWRSLPDPRGRQRRPGW